MLEAVDTDLVFTINLKRSTQNLQLSTSSPADYPIFGGQKRKRLVESILCPLWGDSGLSSVTSKTATGDFWFADGVLTH